MAGSHQQHLVPPQLQQQQPMQYQAQGYSGHPGGTSLPRWYGESVNPSTMPGGRGNISSSGLQGRKV